ncbi:MAG: hypothetical protein H6607_01040 [Flavobacteriales bacterium]|nr:hypothetical protein [Flavobacteriales bacterium]
MTNKVSVSKAHRRGVFRILVLPIIIVTIVLSLLVWGLVVQYITPVFALITLLAVGVLLFIFCLWQVALWKKWMVEHSANPKTSEELAKTSFLKRSMLANTPFLWGKKKAAYQEKYNQRLEEINRAKLVSASKKYGGDDVIKIHRSLGIMPWLSVFFIGLCLVTIWIFRSNEDETTKLIAAATHVASLVLLVLCVQSIIRRLRTVIKIDDREILIKKELLKWSQLEHIDVIKDSILEYRKTGESQSKTLKVSNLNLSPDYIDELITFFKTIKDNSLG